MTALTLTPASPVPGAPARWATPYILGGSPRVSGTVYASARVEFYRDGDPARDDAAPWAGGAPVLRVMIDLTGPDRDGSATINGITYSGHVSTAYRMTPDGEVGAEWRGTWSAFIRRSGTFDEPTAAARAALWTLPDVYRAMLSPEDVRELYRDGVVAAVGGARARQAEAADALDKARDELAAGRAFLDRL